MVNTKGIVAQCKNCNHFSILNDERLLKLDYLLHLSFQMLAHRNANKVIGDRIFTFILIILFFDYSNFWDDGYNIHYVFLIEQL